MYRGEKVTLAERHVAGKGRNETAMGIAANAGAAL
jgi:hypothetical protein